jgi:hypothetical protein
MLNLQKSSTEGMIGTLNSQKSSGVDAVKQFYFFFSPTPAILLLDAMQELHDISCSTRHNNATIWLRLLVTIKGGCGIVHMLVGHEVQPGNETETIMAIGTITTRVAKINRDVSHDWETLPESTQAFFADYGIKQWYADAHAPCVRKNYETETAWLADVTKRVDDRRALAVAGTIGVRAPGLAETARALAEENARLRAELETAMKAAQVAVNLANESARKKVA